MLNAEVVMYEDKFIICGVDNKKNLKGIEENNWRDDNEWQNYVKKIRPEPIDIRTGTVKYKNRLFGYFYISSSNDNWIYEAKESILFDKKENIKESNSLFTGQAYFRKGSTNEIIDSDTRRRIIEKKNQSNYMEKYPVLIDYSTYTNLLGNSLLLVLALFGTWNEKYEGDLEILTSLTRIDKNILIKKLREYKDESRGEVTFSNGVWKVKNHFEILSENADKIYDNHIESFFSTARKCFNEIDPKYTLDSDKRFAAKIYLHDKKEKYSRDINKSIAETIAILGNNAELFVNCSDNKIKTEIYQFVREFFNSNDWKTYATHADNFQLIAEACPDLFLKKIIELTDGSENAFLTFLNEKEQGITETQYGYQLSWAISNLAKCSEYFSDALLALFQLSEINESFIDDIIRIVVPWYPQTHAPIKMRVSIFKGLAEENINLTWKILMKLMPGVTQNTSSIPKPQYLKVHEIPENTSIKDYKEATMDYINLALEICGNDAERLSDLLDVIDDVGIDIQKKITSKISESAINLTQHAKEYLWDKIQNFQVRYRKYSNDNSELKEERSEDLDKLSSLILSDSTHAYSIRLFKQNQYFLFETNEDFDSEEKNLREKQTDILKNIYAEDGIEGTKSFILEIEDKNAAGICLSGFINNSDIQYMISKSECIENDEVLKEIFLNIDFERVVELIEDKPDNNQAKILSFLPVAKHTISYLQKLSQAAQNLYWKLTPVWGYLDEISDTYETVVKSLNEIRRPEKSIGVLYDCIKENVDDLQVSLVVETLKLNDKGISNYRINTLEEFYIQNLIKWLQEQDTNKEDMILIEWKYLVFLQEGEYKPIYLWNELSTNPEFYISVIKMLCGKMDEFEGTDEERKNLAKHCFTLLEGWKIVPGLEKNGDFNPAILDDWMTAVTEQSKKYDIEKIALNYFGKAAFHSPKDKDGFFINRTVAKYLQKDHKEYALQGYSAEAISSRGAYFVDGTGKREFEIEKEYNDKAIFADEEGMFRFSSTLKSIAISYHTEAEWNIKEAHKSESE